MSRWRTDVYYFKLIFKNVFRAKLRSSLTIIGLVIAAILIVWSKFLPVGPSTVLLEMPVFATKGKEAAYWAAFLFLWVIALPIAEVTFYFMFQACVWTNSLSDWLIASLYAVMNWAWLWFVVGPW